MWIIIIIAIIIVAFVGFLLWKKKSGDAALAADANRVNNSFNNPLYESAGGLPPTTDADDTMVGAPSMDVGYADVGDEAGYMDLDDAEMQGDDLEL